MTAPGTLHLTQQAEGVLAELVNWYDDRGWTLPGRRAIIPGAPGVVAWDCEQVTVALGSLTTATASGQSLAMPALGPMAGVGLVRYATWAVSVVRRIPGMTEDGDPPDTSELTDAGVGMLLDAGRISQCFANLAATANDGTRDWLPLGGQVNAGAIATLGPEGDFAAVEAAVTLTAMEVG